MNLERRRLVQIATASMLLAAGATQTACSGRSSYDAAAADTWRRVAPDGVPDAQVLRELARYATLAANGHNTQPWRFELGREVVTLRPDMTRRTPAVDPDDHHLSGSASGVPRRNLLQAARAFGRTGEVGVDERGVHVALRPGAAERTVLFEAIVDRQCTRSPYDGRALTREELERLDAASASPRVRAIWLTTPQRLEGLAELVGRGVQAQMADAAFVLELKQWIRFDYADAVASRDGLFSGASGNPTLPAWLGRALFDRFFTVESELKKYAGQLRSSAGAVVFLGEREDADHWVEVGRAYQRFALQATAMDIRNAFVNQPVEVPAVRSELAQWLGAGSARPDLVVRFGRTTLVATAGGSRRDLGVDLGTRRAARRRHRDRVRPPRRRVPTDCGHHRARRRRERVGTSRAVRLP
jgi:hypothetical protein